MTPTHICGKMNDSFVTYAVPFFSGDFSRFYGFDDSYLPFQDKQSKNFMYKMFLNKAYEKLLM